MQQLQLRGHPVADVDAQPERDNKQGAVIALIAATLPLRCWRA